MSKEQFSSVWDAIEDTPAKAENMKRRSQLMMDLKNHITNTGMSMADAAVLCGVTEARVSDLMNGKITRLDLDALVEMAVAAGLRVPTQG